MLARQACSKPQQRCVLGAHRSHHAASIKCSASAPEAETSSVTSRRDLLAGAAAAALAAAVAPVRPAAAAAPGMSMAEPTAPAQRLCDEECLAGLESKELVTLPSGLQYRDIVVGKGPTPPTGFQVVVNYEAMTPKGRVFDSSLEKGKPYDIRVGSGQVVAGLDEGLKTMRPGGLRRIYVPGDLAFPKGLKAAAGRPSVPPNSPVMFDVQLLYIPGLDEEDYE